MPEPEPRSNEDYFANLKKRARDLLHRWEVNASDLSDQDTSTLIEELKLSNIELDLQLEELRRTQRDLELTRNRYYAFFDLAPVPYFVFASNGIIEEVNLRASEMIGMTRLRLRQSQTFFTSVLTPDHQGPFLSHLREVFQQEHILDCPIAVRSASGQTRGLLRSRQVRFSERAPSCLSYFVPPLESPLSAAEKADSGATKPPQPVLPQRFRLS